MNQIGANKIPSVVLVAIVLILTFAVYFQLFNHDFLILDDPVYVTDNQHVKSGINLNNIYWAFTSFEAEFWHPVTWISYMIDTQLYGVIPGGYLLTNLFIHLLNSIFVFFLFMLMTKRKWESFLISALFALHPLHVESVAWIAERKEILCGFFWLLSTLAYYYYTKSPNLLKYCLITVFFMLGIMSKTMIVTLPFTFLLLDFWPLKRESSKFNLFIEKIPLFFISIAGVAITLFAQHKGGGLVTLEKYSLYQRVANSLVSYTEYIKKTIWSENLSVFYPVKDSTSLEVIMSALSLVILTIAFLYLSKKQKFLLSGWLWFLGTLVPVIGIVKIGDFAMADRYTYMPLLGLFMILAFGINHLISKSAYKKTWLIISPVIILLCYIPNTYLQIKVWQDSKHLFTHSLKTVENNFLAHHALGELYAGKADMNQAIFHFKKAVEIRQDKVILWIKLGRAEYAAGFQQRAVHAFKKAQALDPKHYASDFYLLCAYLDMQKIDSAKKHFNLLIDKSSSFINEKNCLLLKTYVKNNDFNTALEQLGISGSKHTFASLIIQGHETWKTKYLKQVNHDNQDKNIN